MAQQLSDFHFPQNIINRILNEALPDADISADARSALGKAASIFILFATSHANRVAGMQNRTNLTAQDVVEAMTHMDFDEFAPSLKEVYLKNKKQRERDNEKRRERRRRQKSLLASQSSTQSVGQMDPEAEEDDDANDSDDEANHSSKSASFQVVTLEDSN